MTVTLEQPARALLVTDEDREVPVPASLRYSSDDPLAVHLDFPADISLNGSMVTWTFSRGLLEEGVRTPAGAGDVHIRPSGRFRTVVELHSPYGMALLRFEKAALQRFLLRSYAVVAAGSEEVGPALDRGLTSLLRGV
ncbi:SsgA family sporulation/cell division regulator [Streptomyces akebiae]|uniref:SsgA family sporulation/cell division regulator n=1 Tax=Streptomyces akebiae TaxID=2865673 RepID=A0ABX8Y3I6_9ACTN|nr:SsgA family sporulation/cell division regulator [Streptomyces akebiae]QYX82377.1 SsgA family sporulation/cell division regulator [Streptomyces akebiae]